MNILVTGGAGYIGSHAVLALLERGDQVTVIDNLTTGIERLVPKTASFIRGDIGDADLVTSVIRNARIEAVLHFAGSIVVPHSVADPLSYYENNTSKSRVLIEACVRNRVGTFIFSSTAAVYGTPKELPILEASSTSPENPYGRSKLMVEWILEDVAKAEGLHFSALRYFNVAGADALGRTGQTTPNATHLIKVACEVVLGKRPWLEVFGTDYPTPDGTCIRDYIHVTDLVDAHIAVLQAMTNGAPGGIFNCGYGKGSSVLEVVHALEEITGKPLPTRLAGRRPGDPAALVANADQLRRKFNWRPKHDDLAYIIRSALDWERRLAS